MKLVNMLVIGLILLAGCVSLPESQPSNCEAPLSKVNNQCCVDKNANQVCDIDETRKAETIIRERPIVLIEESCNLPRFSCVEKEITPDFVKLRLRFERDEVIKIKRITLGSLSCQAEFNQELRFNDEAEFVIPCVIDQDSVKVDVETDALIQPILRYSSGQIYNYGTPTEAVLKGQIGGLVKERKN